MQMRVGANAYIRVYMRIGVSPIGLMVRVFATGPADQSSIPGRVIPKLLKILLNASLCNTQHYKARIKGKWSNPGKGVAPSSSPRYSTYCKGSLQVALDYGRPTYMYVYAEEVPVV